MAETKCVRCGKFGGCYTCPECKRGCLKYVADIGAPGRGKSYECTECGESIWVCGHTIEAFKNLDPSAIVPDDPSYYY